MFRNENETAPIEMLIDLIDGRPSPSLSAWLARGLAKFIDGELPLMQALGLPGTPRRIRYAIRDFSLVRAAHELGATRPSILRRAALDFRQRKFQAWSKNGVPPTAKPHERWLFQACAAAELPASEDQYPRILAGLCGR